MLVVPIISLAVASLPAYNPAPRHWKGGRKKAMHCKRKHPLSGQNLYVHPTSGHRQCMICRQLHDAKRRHRIQERYRGL